MDKVFISGVNGFIGRQLATKLLENGKHVTGIGKGKNSLVPGIAYHQCDVLDKDLLAKLAQHHDTYVHLAAITEHNAIVNDGAATLKTNLEGTQNMLDAFIHNVGQHFLYASTGKVYGNFRTLPIREEDCARPLNILGKSKFICERLIDFYGKLYPDRIFSILRIFNIFGEGQKETFLVPTILRQIPSGKVQLGDIKAQRDVLYVRDLISAIVTVAEQLAEIGVHIFNVGSGQPTSPEDIVKALERILHKEIPVFGDSGKVRHDELDIEYCDNSKLQQLGWHQEYTLETGLASTIQNSQ